MPKPEPPPPDGGPKLSIISVTCRICYEGDANETLIAPCHCKGSVGFVHSTCLEKWLSESNTSHCEICQEVFQTDPPKVSFFSPNRGFRSDVLLCTVITLIVIILTYVCLFSHEYNRDEFVMYPAARWAAFSLLVIIAIMLVGYYIWVYSVIRWHSRMWLNWPRREDVVRYVPPGVYSGGDDDNQNVDETEERRSLNITVVNERRNVNESNETD